MPFVKISVYRRLITLVTVAVLLVAVSACSQPQVAPDAPPPGREIPSQLEIDQAEGNLDGEVEASPTAEADPDPEAIQSDLEETAKATERDLKAIAEEAAKSIEATKQEAKQKLEETKAVPEDIQNTAESSQQNLDELAQDAAEGLNQTAEEAAETLNQTEASAQETLERETSEALQKDIGAAESRADAAEESSPETDEAGKMAS